jgi:1-acyl-sn-glycerol-3-phosphate acyltransferase
MFYWILKHLLVGPFLRLVYRPKATGLENVPETGPAILAANHLSFVDSLFIPVLLKRKVVFLGKSDYFDSWRTRWFVRSVGVIPVRREGGAASEAAIRAGIKVLHEGHIVAIYPEGTRSPDGRLYRGKTGMARMALEAQAPVIPVSVKGTDRVMPIGARVPRLGGRVEITYGAPLTFEQYYDRPKDRFVLRSVTDEIMYEIMMLSDQEYMDEYASKVKKDLATPPAAASAEARPEAAREPAPSESPTPE